MGGGCPVEARICNICKVHSYNMIGRKETCTSMYGYRRRGFRFGWLPFVLGFVFLMMLFSGGFHRIWFFIWPLFCVFPLFIAAGAAALFAARRWHGWGP